MPKCKVDDTYCFYFDFCINFRSCNAIFSLVIARSFRKCLRFCWCLYPFLRPICKAGDFFRLFQTDFQYRLRAEEIAIVGFAELGNRRPQLSSHENVSLSFEPPCWQFAPQNDTTLNNSNVLLGGFSATVCPLCSVLLCSDSKYFPSIFFFSKKNHLRFFDSGNFSHRNVKVFGLFRFGITYLSFFSEPRWGTQQRQFLININFKRNTSEISFVSAWFEFFFQKPVTLWPIFQAASILRGPMISP